MKPGVHALTLSHGTLRASMFVYTLSAAWATRRIKDGTRSAHAGGTRQNFLARRHNNRRAAHLGEPIANVARDGARCERAEQRLELLPARAPARQQIECRTLTPSDEHGPRRRCDVAHAPAVGYQRDEGVTHALRAVQICRERGRHVAAKSDPRVVAQAVQWPIRTLRAGARAPV